MFDHQIEMTANGSGTVAHTTGSGQTVSNGGPVGVIADHTGSETFQFTANAGACVAEVKVDGDTYTITGEASGADMKNPMAGMINKPFTITVTCS